MKIIGSDYQQTSTNFKKTYPVIHCVAEVNGKYAIAGGEVKKSIHKKFIKMMNQSLQTSTKPMEPKFQNIRAYIADIDADYSSKEPKVRTYNDRTGNNPEHFIPRTYIISGKDVGPFEELYGKKIGKEKHNSKKKTGNVYNELSLSHIKTYYKEGLHYVTKPERQLKDSNGNNLILYTYSTIIRDMFGNVKDYVLNTVSFFAERK